MAKITRYDGNFKAFGSDATGTERTVFGSTTQTDDLTTNLGAEYQRGWGVLPSGQKPPKQYFNGALFGTSQAVAYLHQAGIAEWNGEQEYHAGSITNRNGQIFVCLKNDHVSASAPETDSTNWRLDDGSVATISALLNRTTVGTVNVLNYHTGLEGGGGVFYWDASKPKTEHNGGTVIDPTVTFPSDWNNQTQLTTWFTAGSSGSGCWVRQYDGVVNVKWFGAKGDGVSDDTKALQQAFSFGSCNLVELKKQDVYKCSLGLNVTNSINGNGATLKFYGVVAGGLYNSCLYQNTEASLYNFTIDASNVESCQYGLFVDTDFLQKRTCYYDLTIVNISNSDSTQSANGALFYKSSSASVNLNSNLDIKINVENITATSNSVIGDTGGSATGILVSFNGVGCDGNVVIRDSDIKNISSGGVHPEEDSCAVTVFQGDGSNATAKGNFTVRNVRVYNALKRGFKVQAANTFIDNCTCYGQNTLAGFETYAANTTFVNCSHLLGSHASFTTTSINTKILNCYAEITQSNQSVRFYPGCSEVYVDGLCVKSTATYQSIDYGAILFEGAATPVLKNVVLSNSTNTGSAIICSSYNAPRLYGLVVNGFNTAVYLAYNTGEMHIINANIQVSVNGFYRLGNTLSPIYITDSIISANSIGFFLESSSGENSCTVDAENVKVFSNAHGAIVESNSRFVNCEFTSTGTVGYGILCGNSIVRQCRINKYSVGIGYSYTTTAEIANNVVIGTATPYEKIGYTAFVDYDNYAR